MPNADHYAIVVGLKRYPGLGETAQASADLKGPENDADSIVAWLTSPDGGDVPGQNVSVIKSSDFPQSVTIANAAPTRDQIEQAFLKLDSIASDNVSRGLGSRVGRRLYIYMSGHGFSPRRNHGCLFVTNATSRYGSHVYPSSWLEWFQDAAYFDEYVLWMDCCMNRISTLPLSVAPVQPLNRPSPAGSTFIAFAAQRPLKAVERLFAEDNKVHGVFTSTLLEGLQGAAVDANGRVTGRGLADWLRNAQKTRMNKPDLDDPDVADEPEISREDGIVFARGIAPKKYPVELLFPASTRGSEARVWSGRPLSHQKVQVDADSKTLSLGPGLYVVDVPGKGLRQGFEVTGPAKVDVSTAGPPVTGQVSAMFSIDICPQESATEIFIVDEHFELVDRSAGTLNTQLPPGIYKFKTRLSRTTTENIVLVDGNVSLLRPPATPIASAAPLPNTTLIHEYHVDAAGASVSKVHATKGAGARLVVMARAWSDSGQTTSEAPPWKGVRIYDDKGTVIADLDVDGERHLGGDPFALCSLAVDPGTYFLRHRLEDTEVEQSLIVPKDWFLHAYVLRLANPGGAGLKPRPRLSIIMHRTNAPPPFSDQLMTTLESARIALADERQILNNELDNLLVHKFDNPIAGILGGHLLLIDQESSPTRSLSLLNEVVRNLRNLVGRGHPDVEALSLRCPDAGLRCTTPFEQPPMFQRSWTLLFQASQQQPDLLPEALWKRVQAHSTLPPYLIWAADEESKRVARDAFVKSIMDIAGPALQTAFPQHGPMIEVATSLARRAAASSHFKKLSKQILDKAKQSPRLQVPPSALNELNKEVLKKLKG